MEGARGGRKFATVSRGQNMSVCFLQAFLNLLQITEILNIIDGESRIVCCGGFHIRRLLSKLW